MKLICAYLGTSQFKSNVVNSMSTPQTREVLQLYTYTGRMNNIVTYFQPVSILSRTFAIRKERKKQTKIRKIVAEFIEAEKNKNLVPERKNWPIEMDEICTQQTVNSTNTTKYSFDRFEAEFLTIKLSTA